MDNLDKKIKEINEKIERIDKKIEESQLERKQREERDNIGIISVENGLIHIELMLDKDLFSNEDLDELKEIANNLQNLLLKIQDKMEVNK